MQENVIICGDCLEVMKDFPDGCADLVLTDPPYNVGIDYGQHMDDMPEYFYYEWCGKWFSECQRIAKAVMFTPGIANLDFWLTQYQPRWVIAWIKSNSMRRITIGFNCWEPILLWGKPKLNIYRDIIESPTIPQRDNGHPAPKPIALFEQLTVGFSESDSLILDPFCGSGTTCLAAKMSGRRYIGIDISSDYCEIARKRLEAVDTGVPVKERNAGQMPMFPAHDG